MIEKSKFQNGLIFATSYILSSVFSRIIEQKLNIADLNPFSDGFFTIESFLSFAIYLSLFLLFYFILNLAVDHYNKKNN